jgi:hypothetical protein
LLSVGGGLLVLDPSYFATISGTGNVQGTVSGHGQFLYNSTTRTLLWDADGSGTASGVALATFDKSIVLTAADFAIVPEPVVGDISISDVTITEGEAGTKTATFTVSRTGTAAFTIDYATADDTATAGLDYAETAGTLSFAFGQATQTVSVTINGDTGVEANEAFFVQLMNAGNGGNIVKGQGTGTILNDDVVGAISISDVMISEGDAGTTIATFTVSRTGNAAFTVDFTTADDTATADVDYETAANTLDFAYGQASQTISVMIAGDLRFESDETFVVDLMNASNGGTISKSRGVGTIINDDVAGAISITDATVAEGDDGSTTVTFTVSRTGHAAFTVDFATADGTATAGVDYEAASGVLSFAEGEATQTISVLVNGDTSFEPEEMFLVNLANASNGGTLADGEALGTLGNDDPLPPGDIIYVSDYAISEGDAGTATATFTVSRTGTTAMSVEFATADGTATAGLDYEPVSGTLSFAEGITTQSISVAVNGDTSIEDSETFFVDLFNQTNGVIVDDQALGLIVNDDLAPTNPTVVAVHDTTVFGSPDPSGLAYVPWLDTLFLCDSEADESPFFGTKNLFALNTDGTLKPGGAMSLLSFSKEPTGLAFDPTTGHMLVSDDRGYKVYWVDPANPTVKLGEFLTRPLGGSDPEDIAVDPVSGRLFICNGSGNTHTPGIIEVDGTGTQVFSTIAMPSEITDSEALAYDALHDVFYVGGKFSSKIWVLDRSGTILDTIDLLDGFRRPDGSRAKVTDLELAPSSDPNDAPTELSLYVADYGVDQVSDGRLFEINLGDPLWA